MAFDRAAEAPKHEEILAEMRLIELVVPLNMQPSGIITAGTQGCDEPYVVFNSYEFPGCRPPLELFPKAVVPCERLAEQCEITLALVWRQGKTSYCEDAPLENVCLKPKSRCASVSMFTRYCIVARVVMKMT